jgi:predicted extracellular nuclease
MYIVRSASFIVISLIALSGYVVAQKQYTIAEVQGDKNVSPHEREDVSVTGVVTARTRTGFFIQTPDDKIDANPSTSEGIFVFTKNAPPGDITVGALVTAAGEVQEYRNRQDTASLSTTEISHRLGQDSYKVVSAGNALPKPVVLSVNDFKPNTIDELERYEGMRVAVSELTVVAPTDGSVDIKNASSESSGVYFGVIKGMERPFREPGLDIREFLSANDREKIKTEHSKLLLFDTNPEILRIESAGQAYVQGADLGQGKIAVAAYGKKTEVTSQALVKNIVGVLHYGYGRHTILPDLKTTGEVTGTIKPVPLPAPSERQFSIAGMNLENFFDDKDDPDIKEDVLTPEAFARRLRKVSMAIRDYLQNPDVIGVVEVENLATLKRLAERINSDAVAAGKPDPKYVAYLEDGNDGRGIDNGFLVKTSRVKAIEIRQFGKGDKYKNPDTGEDNFLNDRPPLMLRVAIDDAKTGKPFEFIVIVNHLKSFLGYSDPKQMANVRMKKRLQAEFLARFVQERLKSDRNEMIALVGDFNAFQFNDGVMDIVGTIKGKPASKDEVLMPSDDLLDTDLTDLVDVIKPSEKYSYTFDGNAQAIDHFIISPAFVNHVKGFGYARLNADFPEMLRNDDSRVERYSDHDPAIAFFSLDR